MGSILYATEAGMDVVNLADKLSQFSRRAR
jgi:hypothetical protein